MKLRPFSHLPKTSCLIPGTSVEVEICPALLRFYELGSVRRKLIKEENIPISGPVEGFTILQDLEKEVVSIFGKGLYYHILPDLTLLFKKKPPSLGIPKETLFLGVNKSQDWEMIKRRLDFKEIFPLWFRLGNLVPNTEVLSFSLLEKIEEAIGFNRPEKLIPLFRELFLFSFRSMMVPRILDDEYQGIENMGPESGSPLFILREGMRLIRLLFFQKRENGVSFLPHLPPEFFSGSFENISSPPYGTFSFEWTKKQIRQILFKSEYEGSLMFEFKKELKRFRLRENSKERGKIIEIGNELEIKSKRVYLLDRFEK